MEGEGRRETSRSVTIIVERRLDWRRTIRLRFMPDLTQSVTRCIFFTVPGLITPEEGRGSRVDN